MWKWTVDAILKIKVSQNWPNIIGKKYGSSLNWKIPRINSDHNHINFWFIQITPYNFLLRDFPTLVWIINFHIFLKKNFLNHLGWFWDMFIITFWSLMLEPTFLWRLYFVLIIIATSRNYTLAKLDLNHYNRFSQNQHFSFAHGI